ncbi:YhfG family protein [Motilimonas eburnea]|uniref:YhfG family protein n=1 Tax=Motilimonas eburnea TaxID=1737488 RepID=UPI001E4024E0|nr:YhfG family protein [Motilimonas eburnea]MCE2571249.1 YhfG family protein [Motilimonas eburnea]
MANYADKHAYYEQVKMDNYKESMRLEGFEHSAELDLAQNREQHRQQLIEKYSQAKSLD